MAWDSETLKKVFDKTNGRCHLCGGPLKFARYGDVKASAGWEIEHSVARANGGTDHLNNLFPAHVSCNRAKGTDSAAAVRSDNGLNGPPMSAQQIAAAKDENATGGAVVGLLTGVGVRVVLAGALAPLGPLGWLIALGGGAVVGALVGHAMDPEKK